MIFYIASSWFFLGWMSSYLFHCQITKSNPLNEWRNIEFQDFYLIFGFGLFGYLTFIAMGIPSILQFFITAIKRRI